MKWVPMPSVRCWGQAQQNNRVEVEQGVKVSAYDHPKFK